MNCPNCNYSLNTSPVGIEWTIRNPRDVAEKMILKIGHNEREELHVLLLNAHNTVQDNVMVYKGNVSASLVRVGELFTESIRKNIPRVIVVHNHPSGNVEPSGDDLHLTAETRAAGKLLDIDVLDHIIVGKYSFVSLRDRGFFNA
jgi:DNA repair protein RadC